MVDVISGDEEEIMNEKKIHIVFDGPPEHIAGRFVEVEDDTGKSIDYGEWRQVGDYWHLVFPDTRGCTCSTEASSCKERK